jgi:AbrB family looped-hinge helix DNA binding protein
MSDIPAQPLIGKSLLQKVESLRHLPRRETAKRCGYVTQTKTGKPRVNLTDFYDAVLAAKGLPMTPGSSRDRRGREPTFRVSVHRNGQLIIGAAYTEKMNLKPGDEFEIQLGYKHIHLKQVTNGAVAEVEED